MTGTGEQKKKLRPVILINVYDGKGNLIDNSKLPYNGDADKLTDKISELLERHHKVPGVVVFPSTGYELNL